MDIDSGRDTELYDPDPDAAGIPAAEAPPPMEPISDIRTPPKHEPPYPLALRAARPHPDSTSLPLFSPLIYVADSVITLYLMR